MFAPSTNALLACQRVLNRVNRSLAQSLFVVASALLVFLSVALFLQVLFRYVIREPLPWTEELARYALVWFAMLAGATGAWSGQHFVFRWATLVLNERARLILRLLVTLIVLALLAILDVSSWRYIHVFQNQTAVSVSLDMRIPFAGVPIGLSCFFLIYLIDLIEELLGLCTGVVLSERALSDKRVYEQLSGAGHGAPSE
jgi:TRAP-type C4-dicarboxylate transport system permease small subunit